jgi:ketosteroid isomerase-like protein
MGAARNVYRVLMGKLEGKTPLERSRRRWEDGTKKDLREIGWGDVEWIRLAQDRESWWAFVNAVMNLRVLTQRN